MFPVQTPIVSQAVLAGEVLHINRWSMQHMMDGVKEDPELVTLVLLQNPEQQKKIHVKLDHGHTDRPDS